MLDKTTALERAIPLLERAQKEGVGLKLMGGLAIADIAKSGSQKFERKYKDLDFFALNKYKKRISEIFKSANMKPNTTFNALHGATRLIYFDNELECNVDVLIDEFKMCHSLKLKDRVSSDALYTLPPSDLLLTKMQIVEITENDLKDLAALLSDFKIGASDSNQELDGSHVAQILSDDWGFYATFEQNVQALLRYLDKKSDCEVPISRIKELWTKVEAEPKSFKWKMRAKVGKKVKWYEEPEESHSRLNEQISVIHSN